MNLGFEVEAAKPKRPRPDDDAPSQVPMRAGLNGAQRRKPLTDDKKVRHQMARQQRTAAMTAAFARRVEAGDMLLMTDQYERTQIIYQLGFNDALDGKPADPEGVVGYGIPDQYGHPQEDEREWYIKGYTDGMLERGTAPHPLDDRVPTRVPVAAAFQERESSMDTSIQREADLLEAMAHATLDEQRRLAADLDALRATRRLAFEDDRDTTFADEIVADHLTPVVTHALNTTATDWLGEVEDDLPDQDQVQQMAATEASLWWGRTHEAVKADRTELNVQARGWGARWASQYGPYAEVANTAFMSHVAHLARRVLAEEGGQTCAVCGAAIERDPANEDPQTWHHADGAKHDHEAKPKSDGDAKTSRRRTAAWYYVVDGKENGPFTDDEKQQMDSTKQGGADYKWVQKDEGDDSPKTSALRTVADVTDLAAFEVEAATDDEFAFEGVIAAGDSPGKVDPEQSGEAESSLPYDHPIADDYDPMWSEDWPNVDQPVIDPPMTGAGEGTRANRVTAGNPYAPGSPEWFEYEDPQGKYKNDPGRGPSSGVPKDLFPEGGVPLHGDLTPEQEAWLHGRGRRRSVRGEAPWNAGYNDALAGHRARVASKDVGTNEWYYTEGFLAGQSQRRAVVGDPDDGVRGVPEEIEKLDNPDNRPMWPWDLENPGSGAADVADAKNPNDHTSSQHTAASEIEQAIRDHAEHLQGTLKPGDRVGNATVTNVGTHTVQYRTDDGWDGSMQIPFLNGQGESLPSHQRALDATSRLAAFRSTIAANLKKGAA